MKKIPKLEMSTLRACRRAAHPLINIGHNNSSNKRWNSQRALLDAQRPQWQQTMLRIRNPQNTLAFYEQNFGMRLIHEYHFNEHAFSLYFLGTPIPNLTYPPPGSKQSEQLLWDYPGVTLELTHNHDATEQTVINNGNVEPYRGFGHIAFNTDDVYESYERLNGKGVKFQKSPTEGRMKGLSFCLDCDGYWVEICNRNENKQFTNELEYNLSQTMIRVKDPVKALDFYCNKLGMQNVCEAHMENGQFSVYFLSSHVPKEMDLSSMNNEEKWKWMKQSFHPFLELTHNWGTEKDDAFSYHNGNDEPQGFGHTGFLVDDLEATCTMLQRENVAFKKLPHEGSMRGIAFAKDPDNYWVELIQRGVTFL